jgi:predicted AAA+ superfamily ATPase
VGVVNRLARRGELLAGSELYGKAFENWVFHELSAFVSYCAFDGELSYWRLAGGTEVDFVLGDMQVAIEAKSSERITRDHLRGPRSLVQDHPRVGRRVVVCREPRARKTDDGIEILPAATFVRRLWAGELTAGQGGWSEG